VGDIDSGNTAWVLASAALVMVMTPGVAFFYAGMVRPKSVLSVLGQNWLVMAIAGTLWVVVAYSLAFDADAGAGLVGGLRLVGLAHPGEAVAGYVGSLAQTVPPLAFAAFQMMFAIITPALFTGAIAERTRLLGFVVLVGAWVPVVYAPVAHWVFSPVGWLFARGAEDFAGGTVVHVNAGAAALALALVLGRRAGWPKNEMPQHNVPMVVLGAALLWFGWFGFNAGSALGANAVAAYAFVGTNAAACTAALAWVVVERARGGRPTLLGMASGAVAGLVAITPAAGYVTPLGALVVGAAAGALCPLACGLKYRFGFDDALDVVGVHYFGGIVGALSVGILGTSTVGGTDGLLAGGGLRLLGEQALAVVVVSVYSFTATTVLAKAVDALVGLRADAVDEQMGMDLAVHGEVAYDFGFGEGTLGGGAGLQDIAAERITTHARERTGRRV